MSEKVYIHVKCPSCGATGRGSAVHISRDITCPKCKESVRFVAIKTPASQSSETLREKASPSRVTPQPKREPSKVPSQKKNPPPLEKNIREEGVLHNEESTESFQPQRNLAKKSRTSKRSRGRKKQVGSLSALSTELRYTGIVAIACMVVLAVSPFFRWVQFGRGGVSGISGDGKIVLCFSVLALVCLVIGIMNARWLTPLYLGVQVWNTIAIFWMGRLIWLIESAFNNSELKDNPLASLITSQVSAGVGLYLGLIGSLLAGGAVGFILVRRMSQSGGIPLYFAIQGIGLLLGIVVALLVGSDRLRPSAVRGNGLQIKMSSLSTSSLKKPHNVSSGSNFEQMEQEMEEATRKLQAASREIEKLKPSYPESFR